jgi:hypothetical protein
MEITRDEYLAALDVVEAYHKQIGLTSITKDVSVVIDKMPPQPRPANQKIQRGSIMTCIGRYGNVRSLTIGKDYPVHRIIERWDGVIDFVIHDDNGKPRKYGDYNSMFEVKQY